MNTPMQRLCTLAALCVPLLLAACATLPSATRAEIEAFDPLTFDPNAPRIALIAPDFLEAMPNGARITLNYWPKSSPEAAAAETFVLRPVRETAPAALNDAMRDGERVTIFRIDPKDHDRVRRIQALYAAHKHDGAPKLGSRVDASVKACRLVDLPSEDIRGSVFVKLGANRPYVPLMQDVDIREMLKDAAKSINTEIGICPSARAKTS